MKNKKINLSIIITFFFAVSFISCTNDLWSDHYDITAGARKNMTLYQYIKTQEDLSTFSKMLNISGYDSVLNNSQTYTVWAPDNDALKSINLKDTSTVTDLVKNHIARFSCPTSEAAGKYIYMLDKKLINFGQLSDGYSFGGNQLEMNKSNISTFNGVLHTIKGYVPYMTNIWEYIGKTPGLDSLKAYLYSQSKYEFDPVASVEIGTDEFKRPIYDSVITFTNPILKQIGYLQREDSIFTALLPNNNAWSKAYNTIKSYFVVNNPDAALAQKQQRLNTQWNIVNNLVFRQQIIADPSQYTRLVSSTGNVLTKPADLFAGAQTNIQSNGLTYTTDSLRFKPSETYQKRIVIEAENADWGRTFNYANLYVRSALGTNFSDSISGSDYLYIQSATVQNYQLATVTFPIPNTLSGKYNIYCVFAPSNIATEGDKKTYKAKFYFTCLDSKGNQISNGPITFTNAADITNHKLNTVTTVAASVFTTSSQKMTKVPVLQYKFPYCNLITDPTQSSNITVKLRVENAAMITESVTYDRNLRVDCIILEPVQ